MATGIPSTLNPLGDAVEYSSALDNPSLLLSPKMDIATGEFESLVSGRDPIDAQVILALKIVRGSGPSVASAGTRFVDIRKITQSTPQELKAQVHTAWKNLIARGDIRYVDTIIDYNEPGHQMVQIRPQWVNLRAMDGKVRSTTLVVNPSEV